MTTATLSDYRHGTCKWCGNEDEIYRDTLYCESCDSDTAYCSICRQRQHYESKCRHIFQDEYFEWRGAGFSPEDSEMKVPFHRLLSAMGEEFAFDLKTAIKSGKFYTWMVAPMIGGGGSLSVNGMPERDGKWTVYAYGDKLIELGESERAAQLSDGYRWLVSLYKTKTAKANRTTVNWIDQWLWPFSRLEQKEARHGTRG